jgi:hypothetical protein
MILQFHAHATDIYFSPLGKGLKNGTSATNAYAFNPTGGMNRVNGATCLANLSLTNLTLHFAPDEIVNGVAVPGDYLITEPFWLVGDSARTVAIVGDVASNGIRPRFKLWPMDNDGNGWTQSVAHHTMFKAAAVGGLTHYLGRLMIENLELDGNFTGQGAWTSAANATGYKSFAIDVAAKTGRIRNVTVRNFGSVGEAPTSQLFPGSAGETFPVMFNCYDTGQSPVGSDPAPWVVEDVEVSDFHSVHSGYATLIMPIVFQPTHGAYASSPVAIVRRCKLRDDKVAAIALGTAKAATLAVNDATITPASFTNSGAIRFEDNIILNSLIGFNTDTGPIGPLWFTNNAFLDVGTWGALGEPDSGINHKRYGLTDNLVRLRGRVDWKSYMDVCISDPNTATTDPNLALGRSEPRNACGLMIQGAAGEIYLERNDFTTWPLDNFNLPEPTNSAFARFHLVWKLMSGTSYYCWLYPRNRPVANNVVFTTNRLSNVAYDFTATNSTILPSATYTFFDTNSAPLYEDQRTPTTTLPSGLVPKGRIGNVLAVTNGSARLIAVQEVQIGTVSYNPTNGSLTVNARLAKHQLAAGGVTGTVGVSGQTLRLQCIRRNPDWTTVTNLVAANYTTLGNGTTTFTVTGLSGQSGVCRLTAWLDGGTGGSGSFEPNQDAWAAFDFPLNPVAVGGVPVVDLTTTIDVGDDKNTGAAKRARILATRNGSTNAALTVTVTLQSNVHYRPGTGGATDLAATYGTTGTADYSIQSGTGTWNIASPFTTGSITIPAGALTGEVQVVTRADNLTEQNLIVCRLAATTSYAPGVSTNANILIFDGPEWTVTELNLNNLGTTISSLAYAVNNASPPAVAGYGTFANGGYDSRGGWWQLPNNSTYLSLYSPVYRGLSTSPVKLVGTSGNNAVASNPALNSTFNLPNMSSQFPASEAWGITADETVIVGAGKNVFGYLRPVAWTGSGSSYAAPVDLGGSISSTFSGRAFGVNSAKQVVGQQYVLSNNGWQGDSAFRTAAGSTLQAISYDPATGVGDILHAPGTTGSSNAEASANAVGTDGKTAGWSRIDQKQKATFWPDSNQASSSVGINLGAWKARFGNGVDSHSEARGIATAVINGTTVVRSIVGWSGSSGLPVRAVIRRNVSEEPKDWLDLNDRHFVHGTSGWVLKEATAINSTDAIVGIGSLSGNTRGFVLIPRTTGN